jgi:hypothetical protein
MTRSTNLNAIIKRVKNFFYKFTKYPPIKNQLNKPPIIICGCGRSGTTLLLSILSAHPKICAIDFETYSLAPHPPKTEPVLDNIYWELAKLDISKSCHRWCEKTPRNVLFLDKILPLFNNKVKIIHIVRDGRDVILSKHPSAPNKFHVEKERWINDVSSGLKYKKRKEVFTVHYEDLILNFKPTIKKLLDFIDESHAKEILDWYSHTKIKKNKAWADNVSPIYKKSIGKWKKKEFKTRIDALMHDSEAVTILKELNYIK